MCSAIVVTEDRVVRFTGLRHPDRAELTHANAVAEAGAAEHELRTIALDLEQRALQAAEQTADVKVTGDLDRRLVADDRQRLDPARAAALLRRQRLDVTDLRILDRDARGQVVGGDLLGPAELVLRTFGLGAPCIAIVVEKLV